MTQSRMYESSNHTMMDATSSFSNVNPSIIQFLKSEPGHCSENHTGSHLEDDDKATPSIMAGNSNRQCLSNLNGKVRKYYK